MPDGSWPSPVGVGGGTTPPFGHPSLKEGNVRGSLASAGRRCILLRQPSPARRPSPPRPQAAPTKGPTHHSLSESNAPSLPQTVSTQGPEHHGEPERITPSPPQTASVPRHSPPLRRGGRRPGWSARDGRQAVADTSRTSSAGRPTISATRSGSKPLASMLRTIWRFSSSRPCSMPI